MTAKNDNALDAVRKILSTASPAGSSLAKPAARSGLTISDPTAEAEAMIERLLRQRAGA